MWIKFQVIISLESKKAYLITDIYSEIIVYCDVLP